MPKEWKKPNYMIDCCKDCVPPKRYPGCGATCKEYKEQKARYEKDKERARANKSPEITSYDFDEIKYAFCKKHKRKRRY